MNASSNPLNGLATYLETVTQIYEAAAAARFLRSVEQFDFEKINDFLEHARCSQKSLAERFARLPEAAEFDALLLADDLNSLPAVRLRTLCRSLALDSHGAKPDLLGRMNALIREKANIAAGLPADATESLLAAAASDEARSAAARALSIGLSGFGSLMEKPALRQVMRLTFSLHHAARRGGIERYLAEDQAALAKLLADSPKDAAPASGRAISQTPEPSLVEEQAFEAEQQYLALLQSVRTESREKIERDFAALKSRPAAVIRALGKLRGYSEPSAKRLLDRLWSNIELAAATAQRGELRK